MDIKIYRLCECPEFAETCHHWDETEWPRTPEIEEFFSNHYMEQVQRAESAYLPQTFLALRDKKPVGMLSLIAKDHPDFLHLYPWVASVYIIPEFRYSRAAYLLVKNAIEYARNELKVSRLYTYTHLNASLKRWEFLQTITDPFNHDEKVGLYYYDVIQSIDETKRA